MECSAINEDSKINFDCSTRTKNTKYYDVWDYFEIKTCKDYGERGNNGWDGGRGACEG